MEAHLTKFQQEVEDMTTINSHSQEPRLKVAEFTIQKQIEDMDLHDEVLIKL